MTIEDAVRIRDAIDSSCFPKLRASLYQAAIRYAHIRAEWGFYSIQERRDKDAERTAAHNVFIDSCNILSRNMSNKGEDISWRSTLGDDRQLVGDFACYLHQFVAIENR